MIWALVLMFLVGWPTYYAWKIVRNVVHRHLDTDSTTPVHLAMAVLLAGVGAVILFANGGVKGLEGNLPLVLTCVYCGGGAALFLLAFVVSGLWNLAARYRG